MPRVARAAAVLIALGMLGFALAASGCLRNLRTHGTDASGTCESACDHYLDCRESDSSVLRSTCLAECREIFVYRGKPDRESLVHFEGLECDAAVAFVDGDAGQGPRMDERAVRESQTHR